MDEPRKIDPLVAVSGMLPDRHPLALVPSSGAGWFGGTALVAADPAEVRGSMPFEDACARLTRTFEGEDPVLTLAVLPYDGAASVHTYGGAWMRVGDEWREWGRAFPLGDIFSPTAPAAHQPLLRSAQPEMDRAAFERRVTLTKDAIRSGDVYVLNLTYRVRGDLAAAPGAVFARMLADTPAPMAAFMGGPDRSLASVSPERFLSAERLPDGPVVATTEPIKGTAPRDASPAADLAAAEGLAASAKERAEHVMIVDMERNDLGQVCVPGSVVADPLLEVFPTPYCHQMVSSVRGQLRPEADICKVLSAVFPTGSVTGAPKRSAMGHIAELEVSPRHAYTGALVVAMPGLLDSSVLIRTLECEGARGVWGTGCGITIDSDPAEEWRESELKCRPVLGGSQSD